MKYFIYTSFIFFCTYCSSTNSTTKIEELKRRINSVGEVCDYASPNCELNEYCVQIEPKKPGRCYPISQNIPQIIFPLEIKSPTICTQGPLTGIDRTHSYLNTSHAIDLASPTNSPNAKIRAVFDGTVVVHSGCDNKDGEKFNNDSCGQGFGNWIAIFDDRSNFVAFYAHLRTMTVDTGDKVQKAQIIGEEGKTGAAGHRHLHFSIHENTLNVKPADMEKNGSWLSPSSPYKVKIEDEKGKVSVRSTKELPCIDNNDLTRTPFYGAE